MTEPTTTTTTLTIRQFAEWLAAALRAQGLDARAWLGQSAVRVYRDRDFVTCTTREEHYGGPLTLIAGRDRGFARALERACQDVLEFSIADGTVVVEGVVDVAQMSPAAAPVVPGAPNVIGSVTRCGCCGRGSSRGPCVLRTDASGIRGYVRAECEGDFSFA